MRARLIAVLLGCVFLAACPERTATVDAGPRDFDAGVVELPPPELEYRIVALVPDGGTPVELVVDPNAARQEIPPIGALSIETNVPLKNHRVRVFDEVDRAMVSDDTADLTDAGIRYDIVFPDTLKTGHRYVLVVDAESGPELLDVHGRSQPDLRLEFQIAGEKEKPPPPRRRRRR